MTRLRPYVLAFSLLVKEMLGISSVPRCRMRSWSQPIESTCRLGCSLRSQATMGV